MSKTINLREVASCRVDYKDNNEADRVILQTEPDYDISINDEVEITDVQDRVIFQGFVSNIKGVDYAVQEVICHTFEKQLQNRIVDDLFLDINIISLIETIVTTYSDLTFSSTYTSTITIPRVFTKNIKAWDLIMDLLSRIGDATYRIRDKEFILFPRGETLAPISLVNNQNVIIEDGWEQDDEDQVTVLTLLGEKYDESTIQTFTGNGSTKDYVLARIPKNIRVLVNSVEKKLTVDGQSEGDYTLNKRTKTISFAVAPPNTHTIVVEYTFEENIKIVHQADNELITQYGIIEKAMTKKFLQDFDSALDYAIEYVDKKAIPKKFAMATYIQDLNLTAFYPGMRISVIDNFNKVEGQNINEVMMISEVSFEFPNGSIKIGVGEVPKKLSYFLKEQEYNIRQLYEQDDNSEIVQASQTVRDDIDIEIETEAEVWYRDLPDDYLYLADEIEGIEGWWTGDGNTKDISGNGNDGTWAGLTLNDGTVSGGVTISDGAMVFDGTGAVTIKEDILNDFANQEYTINTWIRHNKLLTSNSFGDQEALFSTRRLNSTLPYIYLTLRNSLYQLRYISSSADRTITAPQIVGEDVFISSVFENNRHRLYINGQLRATTSIYTPENLGNIGLVIGDGSSLTNFEGFIYQTSVIKKSLTLEEHQEIYNAGKDSYSPIGNGLVGQWSGKDFEGPASAPTKILDTNNYVKGLIYDRAFNLKNNEFILLDEPIQTNITAVGISAWITTYSLDNLTTISGQIGNNYITSATRRSSYLFGLNSNGNFQTRYFPSNSSSSNTNVISKTVVESNGELLGNAVVNNNVMVFDGSSGTYFRTNTRKMSPNIVSWGAKFYINISVTDGRILNNARGFGIRVSGSNILVGFGDAISGVSFPCVYNEWITVFGTYDGNILKAYLNGVLIAQTSITTTITYDLGRMLVLSARDASNINSGNLNGMIEWVRCWDEVVLSSDEIIAEQNSITSVRKNNLVVDFSGYQIISSTLVKDLTETLGKQYHVAYFNVGGKGMLFINGILEDITEGMNSMWSNEIQRINENRAGGSYAYLDGKIEDLRIYELSGTETDEQIQEIVNSLYNSGAGQRGNALFSVIGDGRERPLSNEIETIVGWWTGNGYAEDVSKNTNDMVWVGTPQYSEGLGRSKSFQIDMDNYLVLNDLPPIDNTYGMISFFYKPAKEQISGILDVGNNTPCFFQMGDKIGVQWFGATGLPIEDMETNLFDLNIGAWNFILLKWENDVLELWIDNVLKERIEDVVLSPIIEGEETGGYVSEGSMEDIRIIQFKGTETPTEIQNIMDFIYNEGNGRIEYITTNKSFWNDLDSEIEEHTTPVSWEKWE